jgi:hypothetical protein
MNTPLYRTGTAPDGRPLVGGIFKMRDTHGLPLDFQVEEAKLKGFHIDWLEAMADCWLNDCLKFDNFVKEAALLCPDANLGDKFSTHGATIIALHPEFKNEQNPVDAVCRYTLEQKRRNQS